MRAHPVRGAAAGGKAPAAADPVAAGHRFGLAGVRRTPGDDGAGIGEDGAGGFQFQERGDEGGGVGDEGNPGDRAIGAAEFLDGAEIEPGLDLVAADGTRHQHAEDPRLVQVVQQGSGNALGAFQLVGMRLDRRLQPLCAGDRVRLVQMVHPTPPRFYWVQSWPQSSWGTDYRRLGCHCQSRGDRWAVMDRRGKSASLWFITEPRSGEEAP